MLADLLNLVAVMGLIAIVIVVIKPRKLSRTARVPRTKTSRAKTVPKSLPTSIQELTKKVADLRQSTLSPYFAKMIRSTKCLKKLKGMQTKVQLLYMDEIQQCKKAIMYLEGSDKRCGKRSDPPVIVKESVSATDSDIKQARILKSKVMKSLLRRSRRQKNSRRTQRSVACGTYNKSSDLKYRKMNYWLLLQADTLVDYLDKVWCFVIVFSHVLSQIDVSTLLRFWWSTLNRVVQIHVIFENDDTLEDTVVVVDFFVPPECNVKVPKAAAAVENLKIKSTLKLCCIPVKYMKPKAQV